MSTTPVISTVSEIAKSPPLRNIRKTIAEATVINLHIGKTLAHLPPSPAAHETTMIDLVDTSGDIQQQPQLTVDQNCTSFGQAIVILSSDSQESHPSFHTVSVHSFPTRKNNSTQMSQIECSTSISSNNPDTSDLSPGDHKTQDPSQDSDSCFPFRRGECDERQAHTATKNLKFVL